VVNVFEEGFLGAGVTLAARLLSSPIWYLTNHRSETGTQRYSYAFVPGTGDFITRPENFLPDPLGPFPYGMDVEPP